MQGDDIHELYSEIADIKSLMILLLQAMEVRTEDIGKALGISKGQVSKLVDKQKYGGKHG